MTPFRSAWRLQVIRIERRVGMKSEAGNIVSLMILSPGDCSGVKPSIGSGVVEQTVTETTARTTIRMREAAGQGLGEATRRMIEVRDRPPGMAVRARPLSANVDRSIINLLSLWGHHVTVPRLAGRSMELSFN